MKNCKKLFSGLLTIGFLATLATGCGAKSSNGPVLGANVLNKVAEKTYTAADFAGEGDIPTGEMTSNISQSTTTKTSQLYELKFRARTSLGFMPSKSQYIAQIVDENFSNNESDPIVPEKKDTYNRFFKYVDSVSGHDLIKEVPLFDGIISYVTGNRNADSNKVYIPSFFVKKGAFAIAVKSITSNATTATGEEYRNKNTWTYTQSGQVKQKISEIHIPNTIETIEAGAFTGVPEDVKIYYEGNEKPVGFADGWTDAQEGKQLFFKEHSYTDESGALVDKVQYTGPIKVTDLAPSTNFMLGYQPNPDIEEERLNPEKYTKPLVVEYVVDNHDENGNITSSETHFQELELNKDTIKNNVEYEGVGDEVGNLSLQKFVDISLEEHQTVNDDSLVVHNIFGITKREGSALPTIDFDKQYKFTPRISYSVKMDVSDLVGFEEGGNSYFCGHSRFSFSMKKNLEHTSAKFPSPHSYYLDLKTDIYEQNLKNIKTGRTVIRYSIQSLFNASYHFVYIGSDGQEKDALVPLSLPSNIDYQILESNGNNVVACIVNDADIAPDFRADKVTKFEIKDLTITMDLFSSNPSGATTVIGKSSIAFTFAYLTIFDHKDGSPKSAFNFNLFLIIFVVGFIVAFALLAIGNYFFRKNRFKNDEFRRVNKKKYIKSAIIAGLGATIFALAVLFIVMRFSSFSSTIVVFNPVDPFVIIFGIAGLIVFGYFIVIMVKMFKAEKERRKHLRLRLDEDVDDDGTN